MNSHCGIYKITNKKTNKIYVGQSVHIEERWKEHLRGKGNKPLFSDFLLYGKENFTFEILELCEKDKLLENEKKWINYFNCYKNGYNENNGGDNSHFAIAKTKKKIFCYDLNGNFLKEYDSLSDAERDTKISNSNISRAAKTEGRTKNFLWSYQRFEKLKPYKRKTASIKNNEKLSKKVKQFDKKMNYLQTFPSIREAYRQTGVKVSSISAVCQKQRKTAGGFIWEYDENFEGD